MMNSHHQKIENTLNAAKTGFFAKDFYEIYRTFVVSELVLNRDILEGLVYGR